MRKKLRALHYAARHSIGIEAGAQSATSELSFLVEKFQLIKLQICRIDKILIRLVDEAEEGKYILSIRGLNYISVAGLLAELGSFRSYRSAKHSAQAGNTSKDCPREAGACQHSDNTRYV